MAESIQINTQVLLDTSESIRQINGQLEEKLNTISETLTGLQSSWIGDASNEIIEAMNAFKSKHFEQYKRVVEEYAKFLVNTAQTYEAAESAVQNNASQFK